MKAVVEWGRPKAETQRQICGISGQFVATNPEQARMLASQLFHTMVEGKESVVNNKGAWGVSKDQPRKVVWASDNSAWVAVSVLDGVDRGPYAGIADREYRERIKAASEKGASK
ncbi:hypothetical protein WJ96_04515 [Burkholderia ubonensis]|uniref:Uncharacterized protein n=1 Tax=Burkholderia ubonensis TaxID=101571 RepID=A0AAW3MSE5_9BURK|nr:hypothetical protein [Burkholderia ubonensis]KVP65636.1 hypothetical protein WJ93_24250 [Burkholderia ubonensis]KVP96494.1 hypothetical protein WJ97_11430 [Burkholderia ubonensis]KVP97839.1 hypothetical protein WJ96_04515 [Burkholderia ubonensis]KVZ92536.1 hypothetical protein WL25_16170 [Burkholderia ubonensis]